MNKNNRSGLVLEGGGMRGIYTAGVLDVFMEQGIRFDGVIGVSAGAVHGCSYVSGQKDRSIRYYKQYCRDKRFISYRNLFKTGEMVGTQFCYHEIPEKLEPYDFDGFNRSGTEFYVTCSNVETGKAEYLRIRDMRAQVDAMRASASLPCISRIVEWEGKKLLDGGCTDSVPYLAFHRMGFGKLVVVLTRHKGYVKKPEKSWMVEAMYRKYPRFVRAMRNRHRAYNRSIRRLEELEAAGKIFVIRPGRPLQISRMRATPEELQKIYDIGRADGQAQAEAVQAWLAGRG